MAASHASSSGAAGSSYGANSTSSHEEPSDFLNNCYAKITAETTDLCTALQLHLNGHPLIHQEHGESSLEAVARVDDALQSFSTVLDARLKSVKLFKTVFAVFFTVAAAFTAAVAVADPRRPAAAVSAAASILLIGAGNWVHSRMKKHESAVEKHKKDVGVMIMGTKPCRKDLTDIHALARKLQRETDESMSENAEYEKTAALKMVSDELRRKADEYSRDVNWVLEVLLKSIVDH